MLTYMASCGDTTCDKFDASDAQWFKIDQMGLKDAASGTWWHQNFCATLLPLPPFISFEFS